MTMITTDRPAHLSTEDALREVKRASAEGREVSDACALTIASWWQSPGTGGRAFAQLSTTGAVDQEDLSANIADTYAEAKASSRYDALALDMLGTWALNHPSRH